MTDLREEPYTYEEAVRRCICIHAHIHRIVDNGVLYLVTARMAHTARHKRKYDRGETRQQSELDYAPRGRWHRREIAHATAPGGDARIGYIYIHWFTLIV